MLDFATGEVQFPQPTWLLELGREVLGEAQSYPPVAGAPDLRAAYAAHRRQCDDTVIDPDRLLVTSGAREGVWLALSAAAAAGRDVVHVPVPAWPAYAKLAAHLRLRTVPYDVRAPEMALDNMRKRGGGTLVFNFPHNPTGVTWPTSDADAVVAEAVRLGMHLVIDEVYSFLLQGSSYAGRGVPRTIVLDSLSKRLALPGLRVGFASGPADVLADVAAQRSQMGGGTTSTVAQSLATQVLRCPEAAVLACRIREQIRHARTRVARAFGPRILSENGVGMFLLTKPGRRSAETFLRIVNCAQIQVENGSAFGSPEQYRICVARSNRMLSELESRLAEVNSADSV